MVNSGNAKGIPARKKESEFIMARSISKTFGYSKTKAVIKYFDNGEIKERAFEIEGNKSERAINAHVFSKLKTRNFMLVSHENVESEDETTYTMSADSFVAHSKTCENGKSYGHDTVTATFISAVTQTPLLKTPRQTFGAELTFIITLTTARIFQSAFAIT